MLQVRKIKRGACEYDYVEIMACPSGCLNGGGQMKPRAEQSSQQLLEQLDQIYHDPQACARVLPLHARTCHFSVCLCRHLRLSSCSFQTQFFACGPQEYAERPFQ